MSGTPTITRVWGLGQCYIYAWERFAGKPYVKNAKKPGTIRETVRRAQDTLYRLKLGRETQHIADMIDRCYGGGNFPQSLGELCLELAGESLVYTDITAIPHGVVETTYFRRGLQRDIQNLRGLMYHKHKDPRRELATQRLERLVELVRTA